MDEGATDMREWVYKPTQPTPKGSLGAKTRTSHWYNFEVKSVATRGSTLKYTE